MSLVRHVNTFSSWKLTKTFLNDYGFRIESKKQLYLVNYNYFTAWLMIITLLLNSLHQRITSVDQNDVQLSNARCNKLQRKYAEHQTYRNDVNQH